MMKPKGYDELQEPERNLLKNPVGSSTPTYNSTNRNEEDTNGQNQQDSNGQNQQQETKQQDKYSKYENSNYLPSWSDSYKEWLKGRNEKCDSRGRWVMMLFIGLIVGLIGFLMHQFIDVLSHWRWEQIHNSLQEGDIGLAWLVAAGIGIAGVAIASLLVVFIQPDDCCENDDQEKCSSDKFPNCLKGSAAGSGIPQLMGYLNGTIIEYIFTFPTMLVKFISCVFAVSAGMPVGPEGPMVHLGGIVGAGLSGISSWEWFKKLEQCPCIGVLVKKIRRFKKFERLRNYFHVFMNSEERRNFISAGVAAGVSAAFRAPIGGLLFSMEEVSSFWNMELSWQIFFCCMVATSTANIMNSAYTGFQKQGQFGLFDVDENIIFRVDTDIPTHLFAFFPAVILGVIGGILGSIFIWVNEIIACIKNWLSDKCMACHLKYKKLVRMCEPCIIMATPQKKRIKLALY